MPAANYTRRRDLFLDSGFTQPDLILAALLDEARACGLIDASGAQASASLEECLARAETRAQAHLSAELNSLLGKAPEFLFQRNGDLSTLLWLARNVGGSAATDPSMDPSMALFGFGLAGTLARRGFARESAALVRFLVALDFDYGELYKELGVAYGFFQARDPNPFVWKCLDFVEDRIRNTGKTSFAHLDILELGCGIGNDALGFLSSPLVRSYTGTDISRVALDAHEKRVAREKAKRPEVDHSLREGDFVGLLSQGAQAFPNPVNFIYSYSSLHYFSSEEVKEIFDLVAKFLRHTRGLFCFAIKGSGSVWDGQGVPMYRPDVWINNDGQSRWFPSEEAINHMIDRLGFEVLLHGRHEHWSYSEWGKPDNFHYVICSPRLEDSHDYCI